MMSHYIRSGQSDSGNQNKKIGGPKSSPPPKTKKRVPQLSSNGEAGRSTSRLKYRDTQKAKVFSSFCPHLIIPRSQVSWAITQAISWLTARAAFPHGLLY
jgi:hypothetical protein